MNKTLIIIAGAIFVVGAGVAGLVQLGKLNSGSELPESSIVLDTSETDTSNETLHACEVVSQNVIEAALEKSVDAPKTSGVTNIGTTGETCYYAFEPNGIVTHSFYVDIEQHDSIAEADEAQSYSGMTEGADLPAAFGSFAKYAAQESPYNGDMEYIMYLQNGTRVTKLIIAEKQDKQSFNAVSARNALDQIVKEAKLVF